MGTLFDSTLLKRLEALRLRVRRVPTGGRVAEHRSAGRGGGVEFADYRDYAPGEDMRRIDWNVWRRLGRLYLRTFVEELDLPVHIALDLSDSVFHHPERIRAARVAAGAFAWIGVSGHDRVRVHPFGGRALPSFGPVSARPGGMDLLRWLEGLEPAGGTRLIDTLKRIRGVEGRRGVLVVVSDFFTRAGLAEVVAEIGRQRHRVLLIQLHHPEDAEPALGGEVRLEECETGELCDITVTPALLARYREAYRAFEKELHGLALNGRAGVLRLDVTGDVVGQLEALFPGGRMEA